MPFPLFLSLQVCALALLVFTARKDCLKASLLGLNTLVRVIMGCAFCAGSGLIALCVFTVSTESSAQYTSWISYFLLAEALTSLLALIALSFYVNLQSRKDPHAAP